MDKSLGFLYNASNDDLKVLTDIITLDKRGNTRVTETLTITDSYKSNYPHNIRAFLPDLIDELERFGGNTFANIIRGEGVPYSRILRKVAKRLKVKFDSNEPDGAIERALLEKLLADTLENASDEELKELVKEVGDASGNVFQNAKGFSRQATITALMAAFRHGAFGSYQLTLAIVNNMVRFVLGRGLTLAANATLTRVASIFVGPAGWIAMGLWTIVDIAGPAYRVMIPAVVQIAYIREIDRLKRLKILPE